MPTLYSHPSFQTIRGESQSRSALSRSSSYFYRQSQPLSLFDRLPLELHAEVFSYCLPAYPSVSDDGSPMQIAQVCRTWRTLVETTPRLWSSFEIEVQDSGSEELTSDSLYAFRLTSRVQLWLERSRNQPLSIRVIHIPTGRVPSQLSGHLLALLVHQARRWRHIEFAVPSTSLTDVQQLFPEDFPVLRSLKLQMSGGGWTPSPVTSTPFDMGKVKVPWHQLTELDLRLDQHHLLNLEEYADLLAGARNLMVCRLNAKCVLKAQQKRDRLELPSLKKLHLILQGGSEDANGIPHTSTSGFLPAERSLITFLGLFAGCSLTHLGLNWLVDGDRGDQWAAVESGFMTFVRAQSPTLQSLQVNYLPLKEESLLQCFSQCPRLTDLDLRFSLADQVNDPITGKVLDALTLPGQAPGPAAAHIASLDGAKRRPSDRSVMPHLKRLHIQCTGAHCTQQTLMNLLHSRIQAGRPARSASSSHSDSVLARFRFYSMQQVITDIAQQERVRGLLQAGLDVDIDSVVLL